MRRLFFMACVIFILVVTGEWAGRLHAQGLECTTPGCTASWVSYTTQFSAFGGFGPFGPTDCYFEVHYRARDCNGTYVIQILSIEWVDGCGGMVYYPITLDIRRWAWAMIINKNDPLFPPEDEGCNVNYELAQGTCWHDVLDQQGNVRKTEPCNEICCSRKYKVCIVDGIRIATPTAGFGWGWPPCEESDPGEGCTDYCQILDDIYVHDGHDDYGWTPAGAQKRASPDGTEHMSDVRREDLTVRPDPVHDGIASIEFQAPASAPVEVRIFDAEGRLASTLQRHDVKTGTASIQIDLSALTSGTYYVEIRQADKVVSGGSVRLVK